MNSSQHDFVVGDEVTVNLAEKPFMTVFAGKITVAATYFPNPTHIRVRDEAGSVSQWYPKERFVKVDTKAITAGDHVLPNVPDMTTEPGRRLVYVPAQVIAVSMGDAYLSSGKVKISQLKKAEAPHHGIFAGDTVIVRGVEKFVEMVQGDSILIALKNQHGEVAGSQYIPYTEVKKVAKVHNIKEKDFVRLNPDYKGTAELAHKFAGLLSVESVSDEKGVAVVKNKAGDRLDIVLSALVVPGIDHKHHFEAGESVTSKHPSMLQQYLQSCQGFSRPESRKIAYGNKTIAEVSGHSLRLIGWANWLPVDFFVKFVPVETATEAPLLTNSRVKELLESHGIGLEQFYAVAHQVKRHTKESVVLHMSAEVGEIAECLVQPEHGGNIVEESVDVILCALDVIYLELKATHGTKEITQAVNKMIASKLEKWLDTCKKTD